MATDAQIEAALNDYLRARGFTCGRQYADVGDVTRAIVNRLANETRGTLEPKVRQMALDPRRGFKTRAGGQEVSASDPSDDECGG